MQVNSGRASQNCVTVTAFLSHRDLQCYFATDTMCLTALPLAYLKFYGIAINARPSLSSDVAQGFKSICFVNCRGCAHRWLQFTT